MAQDQGKRLSFIHSPCELKTITCFIKFTLQPIELHRTPFVVEQAMLARLDPLLICSLGCCVRNQQPSFLSWAQKRRIGLLGEGSHWCFPSSCSMRGARLSVLPAAAVPSRLGCIIIPPCRAELRLGIAVAPDTTQSTWMLVYSNTPLLIRQLTFSLCLILRFQVLVVHDTINPGCTSFTINGDHVHNSWGWMWKPFQH